jgi:hypothetical protein
MYIIRVLFQSSESIALFQITFGNEHLVRIHLVIFVFLAILLHRPLHAL